MMNVVVGALVVLLLASLFGVVRGVLLVVRLRRIGAPRGAVHTRWPLPAPAARPATAPPPQPLTGGHAPPPAPPRAAGAPGGAQALSRLEKLEIAREVLDHRFPADLQEELDGSLAQRTASASHAGGGDLETSAALPPRLDAPDEPPELTALAGALDLATGAGPDDFGSSIVDRRPLLPPPDVAAVTPARAWYGPLLSFENVLFLLSGVLILGGTVYFAATTWGRVPGRRQPLYLEALVLVNALLLVGAGQLLLRRLRLPGAARILLAIAAAVGLLSALVAATTPAAYAQTAVLCAVIAALFAGGTLGRLLRGYDDPGRGAALFGGAALLLGLTGVAALWAPLLGAPLAAAGAATLACAALPRQGPSGHRLVVSLAGAVPLTALLIPLGGAVPLLAVAPAIGAWTWLAALGYGPTDGAGGGPALGFGGTRLAPALLFGAVGLGGVACWGEPAPTLLFALVALGGAADAARRAPGLRGPVRAALAVWALAVAALPFAIRDLWPDFFASFAPAPISGPPRCPSACSSLPRAPWPAWPRSPR